jgi:hypothetical protein
MDKKSEDSDRHELSTLVQERHWKSCKSDAASSDGSSSQFESSYLRHLTSGDHLVPRDDHYDPSDTSYKQKFGYYEDANVIVLITITALRHLIWTQANPFKLTLDLYLGPSSL